MVVVINFWGCGWDRDRGRRITNKLIKITNKLIKINIMPGLIKEKFYLKLFPLNNNNNSKRNFLFQIFIHSGIKLSKHFVLLNGIIKI